MGAMKEKNMECWEPILGRPSSDGGIEKSGKLSVEGWITKPGDGEELLPGGTAWVKTLRWDRAVCV